MYKTVYWIEAKDATKILVQINNLNSIERMQRNIVDTDIYIKPDISQYGVISFDKGKEIIRKAKKLHLPFMSN
jgi:NTE family protein